MMLRPLALAALFATSALAHDHGEHAEFFRSLKVPVYGGSCCNERDCAFTDAWRVIGERFEVLHEGRWLPVPDDRVLTDVKSPTGRAVACIMEGRVICFVLGTMI